MNLVTGATGIIGSQVVLQLLQQGKPVVAAKQKGSDVGKVKKLFGYYGEQNIALFEKIKWVDMDVTDIFSIEDALTGIDTVYHCAGFVSFQEADLEKLKHINETGTANLVNVCVDKKVKAFCHVSSISAVNNNDYLGKLSESVFWKTSGKESNYAISKYNAEREVWRGIEEGLQAVIVNPGVVLSPGFWQQSSGKLFPLCSKGNLFYTEGKTGYVAVEDVAKVMIALVDKGVFNERFIVIENNYTTKDMLGIIQNSFNKKGPSIKLGQIALQTAGIIDGIATLISQKERRLSRESIRSTVGSKEYSNEKVRKALNFEFSPLKDHISFICKAYLKDLSSSKN